ncbi:alginate O-acetyltransferase AlgX-related protein [Spirosoma areae]
MKLKLLLYNLIFVSLLLISTFLLGEIGLRIYNYFVHSHIFYDSSYNRYRGKPHVELYGFRLNSGGFNDTEFTAKPSDYRIIGLGDSFAFGIVPHQYTYLTKLENKLNNRIGNICLFNMGISQTNPTDYYSILTNEGAHLKPDLVLVSFFIGNDFDVIKKPWFRHSFMLTALNYIGTVAWKVKDFAGHEAYADSAHTFRREDYLKIEKERMDSWKYHMPDKGPLPGQKTGFFEQTIATLLRTRDYCTAHGAKFMVTIIPDELQVDSTLQQEVVSAYYPTVGRLPYDVLTPTRLLTQRLRANGIPYIDMLEAFQTASSAKRLYKPSDSHWNIAGNEFAAQLLADSLVKFIPKQPDIKAKARPHK